jgi:hypothetical protein
VGLYAAAAVLVVGLVGAVLFRPAPAPVVESFTEAGARWHLDSNPESRATAHGRRGVGAHPCGRLRRSGRR